MKGLTLDAGALLALERGEERLRAAAARRRARPAPRRPCGVLAEAGRGGARQARTARLLNDPATTVVPLDAPTARAVGVLCGRTGHHDIVDVSVALCARTGDRIVTSDPTDLHSVDPTLTLIVV